MLTAENAAIFMFDDERFNHLFITEGDKSIYLFGFLSVLKQVNEARCVQLHYMPNMVPEIDVEAYKRLEHGVGVVYVRNIEGDNPTFQAVDMKKPQGSESKEVEQVNPMTAAEVDYWVAEIQDGINWDELS